MMDELVGIKKAVKPHQIYLVVDSMTGQEAVNIASVFKEKIEYDSIVLTKLDSDTRGGAALIYKLYSKKTYKIYINWRKGG
jgi:signal recognition particle subunit SRP54